MAPKKKTNFSKSWEEKYGWVQEVADSKNDAWCKICKKMFSLSNMGEYALISHMQSKKHLDCQKNKKLVSVATVFKKIPQPQQVGLSMPHSNKNGKIFVVTMNFARF